MNVISRTRIGSLLALGLSATVAQAQATPPLTPAPPSVEGPKIQFATPVYDFGRIKSGDSVKYTYVFTNAGNATLEISNVHPSCGCTAAGQWTRRVQPGQTGVIPIEFRSGNYPAGAAFKTITVTSNDKQRPTVMLQLKGTIWKPIEMVPQYAFLNVPADNPNASMVVRIINHTEEQITFDPPQCNRREFALQLTNTVPGKQYQLTISTVPPLQAGTTIGMITMHTSSTNVPVLNLQIYANVQQAVTVSPLQLTLPPAPLPNKTTLSLFIQNNSTNQLYLTDPAINVPNTEVKVTAVQTGKVYTVALTFPQGFSLPHGEPVAFSVKSNHPRFPLIRVPVVQLSRPVRTYPAPRPLARPGFPAPVTAPTHAAAPTTPPTLPPFPPRASAH